MTVSLKIKGLDEMQRQLERFAARGVQDAARETLNGMAWEGRRIWQGELRESSTLRNQFTERRVLVDQARGGNMRTMEATLGHTEDYVRKLEEGEPTRASGSAVPIPTDFARGGNKKNLVRRPNKLSAIGRLKKSGAPTRKARNAEVIRRAARSSKKLAVLDLGRSKGIYRVMGGKRKLTVRPIWDLTHRTVSRPKRPTLARTLDKVLDRAPAIAERAMLKQLRKLGT